MEHSPAGGHSADPRPAAHSTCLSWTAPHVVPALQTVLHILPPSYTLRLVLHMACRFCVQCRSTTLHAGTACGTDPGAAWVGAMCGTHPRTDITCDTVCQALCLLQLVWDLHYKTSAGLHCMWHPLQSLQDPSHKHLSEQCSSGVARVCSACGLGPWPCLWSWSGMCCALCSFVQTQEQHQGLDGGDLWTASVLWTICLTPMVWTVTNKYCLILQGISKLHEQVLSF